MHHGAHGKLKLFHLEDGGFNHQRDYKDIGKLLIKHGADTPKFKSYTEIINNLIIEEIIEKVIQEKKIEADLEPKPDVETKTTQISSGLNDVPKLKFSSLEEINTFEENQTSLGGETDIVESEFFDS